MGEENIELFSGVFVKDLHEEEPAKETTEEIIQVDYSKIAAAQRVDLLAHLRNLNKQVDNVESILERVKSKLVVDQSSEGVSLLQVRNHCFLEYMEQLAGFGVAKCAGESVGPFVEGLVMNRCVLERIKPLEKKLSYQLEKYKEMENNSGPVLRANPSSMIEETTKKEEELMVSSEYQPPQTAPALYPNAVEDQQKEVRFARSSRAHARKNALMEEVVADIRDRPVESETSNAHSRKMKEVLKRLKETEELEEDLMQRLPIGNRDRKLLKALQEKESSWQSILDYEKETKKAAHGKSGKKKKPKKH